MKIGVSEYEKGEVMFKEIKVRISWIEEDRNSLIIMALKVSRKVINNKSTSRHTVLKLQNMNDNTIRKAIVFVHLDHYNTTTDWVPHKQQKFISGSSGS